MGNEVKLGKGGFFYTGDSNGQLEFEICFTATYNKLSLVVY